MTLPGPTQLAHFGTREGSTPPRVPLHGSPRASGSFCLHLLIPWGDPCNGVVSPQLPRAAPSWSRQPSGCRTKGGGDWDARVALGAEGHRQHLPRAALGEGRADAGSLTPEQSCAVSQGASPRRTWGSRSELHGHRLSSRRFSAELNHSLLSLVKGVTCFEKLPAPNLASPWASENPGSTSVQSREALHSPAGDNPVGEIHSGLLLPVLALLTAPAAQHREGPPSATHVTTACGKHSVNTRIL